MFTVKAIITEDLFNVNELLQAITEGLDEVAQDVQKQFQNTTSTWNRQVNFPIESEGLTRVIGTDDLIYHFLNDGTKEHDIPLSPKTEGFIRYFTGGTPKTEPGIMTAGSGSKGTVAHFLKQVTNPGVRAREFDARIADTLQEGNVLQNAIQSRIDATLGS